MVMKMIMRCPNCGANLIFDTEKNIYICEYCGYNEVVTEKVVYQATNTLSNYNLLISNRNHGLTNGLSFTIRDANISRRIGENETMTFLLAPGPHKIDFHIGSKTRKTLIVVTLENNDPVKVLYNGGQLFNVTQPYAGEEYRALKNGELPSQTTPLALVAMILTLSVMFSFWGMILGTIDMTMSKNRGEQPSLTATLAMGLGCIFMFFGMILWGVALRG